MFEEIGVADVKTQNFMKGAAILAAGVALVKIMVAVFKISLANILSDEGVANFYIAHNIYSFLLILSTAGLPVALSRLLASANALGRPAQIKRTFRVAWLAFFVLGMASTLIMLLFPGRLAVLLGDANAESGLSIRVLAPAVVCVCLMSAYRGYTQGLSNMVPTSVSQIIETLCKLLFGLTLAWWLIGTGGSEAAGAAGAIFGVTMGTALGLVYIVVYKARMKRTAPALSAADKPEPSGKILKNLLGIGIPIVLGSCFMSIIGVIDTKMILSRLQNAAGMTTEQAKTLFGVFSNAQTIYNLPPAFIVPLTTSVIPAISASAAKRRYGDASEFTGASLKLTNLIAMPAALGITALSYPIMKGLYYGSQAEGAAILFLLGFASFFVCLSMATNAVLQAYGFEKYTFCSMLAGGAVKISANYILLGMPGVGIRGAAASGVLCYSVISLINLIIISRKVPERPKLGRLFAKPLVSSVLMGACAYYAYRLLIIGMERAGLDAAGRLSIIIALGMAILFGVVVYALLVISLKAISREELEFIPKGEKLARLFRIK